MTTIRFNAQELCSRKLWQLVNAPASNHNGRDENELAAAISELATRRDYLTQLQETGKLGDDNQGS